MYCKDFFKIATDVGLVVRQSKGKHQFRAINMNTFDFITIPSSPSDRRSIRNFRASARRLASTGRGNIAAHGGYYV